MNEKATWKSKSLKGKDKTEQVALWRRNGDDRARGTPKAPTKVEVVGYWPNVENEVAERDMGNLINVSQQR